MAHYLEPLFSPRAIAVFGLTLNSDSPGTRVYRNLLASGHPRPIYAIHPEPIADQPSYPSLAAVPGPVDLAIIAAPAAKVPDIVQSCGLHGVKTAMLMPASFDAQKASPTLDRQLLDASQRYGLRILGPDGYGLLRPASGLNASFGNSSALAGSLALVSQSGSLCAAVLDWAGAQRIGFSALISLGGGVDLDFGDILDYLALDPQTRGILLHMEAIHDARRFMGGLRAAARLKPVVAIKAGRRAEGSRAVLSHIGALVGEDDVFDAALRRAGVVRADSIGQLFAAAQLLATRQRLRGDRLAIITNAGGPGVMATDRAVEQGIRLADWSPATLAALAQHLPDTVPSNPLDIHGDATPERYAAAVDACLRDDNVDGALVLLTPQATTDPTASAEAVIRAAKPIAKPLLACWLGETLVREGREVFAREHLPCFANPESALRAFGFLAEFHANQTLLVQAPASVASQIPPNVIGARLIIEGAWAEHRAVLSPLETRALLHAFHIPVAPALTARTANEALAAAACLGFPVALKILSPDLIHKSDVDGVKLNVAGPETVRHAYHELIAAVRARRPELTIEGVTVEKMYHNPHGRELLVGLIDDPLFGPAVSFGAGGTAVEVLRDRAVALPPLNAHIANSLIHRTRVAGLLAGFRNSPPVNTAAVVDVLLRLSEMACELPEIKELDINPLMADADGVLALDARVVIHDHAPGQRRYSHMAIHPYPLHLVNHLPLNDGTALTIRPVRPEDAALEQAFVRGLSAETRFFRFMNSLQELTPELLIRLTQLDYDRELALLATITEDGAEILLGVARYAANPDGRSAEFALVIADGWQGRGLGTRLLTALIDAARDKGFQILQGEVLAGNIKMLALMRKLGFSSRIGRDDPGIMEVSLGL